MILYTLYTLHYRDVGCLVEDEVSPCGFGVSQAHLFNEYHTICCYLFSILSHPFQFPGSLCSHMVLHWTYSMQCEISTSSCLLPTDFGSLVIWPNTTMLSISLLLYAGQYTMLMTSTTAKFVSHQAVLLYRVLPNSSHKFNLILYRLCDSL